MWAGASDGGKGADAPNTQQMAPALHDGPHEGQRWGGGTQAAPHAEGLSGSGRPCMPRVREAQGGEALLLKPPCGSPGTHRNTAHGGKGTTVLAGGGCMCLCVGFLVWQQQPEKSSPVGKLDAGSNVLTLSLLLRISV